MNGTIAPPKKISGSSLTCIHQNARIGARQKVEGGENDLRKFLGRSQHALGGEEGTLGLERTPENIPSNA
jgi:hypothetical protein